MKVWPTINMAATAPCFLQTSTSESIWHWTTQNQRKPPRKLVSELYAGGLYQPDSEMFDSDSQLRVFPFQMILGEKLEYRNSCFNVPLNMLSWPCPFLTADFLTKGCVGRASALWLGGSVRFSLWCPLFWLPYPFSDLLSGQVGWFFLSQETRVIVLEVAGWCFRYMYLFTFKIPVHLNG